MTTSKNPTDFSRGSVNIFKKLGLSIVFILLMSILTTGVFADTEFVDSYTDGAIDTLRWRDYVHYISAVNLSSGASAGDVITITSNTATPTGDVSGHSVNCIFMNATGVNNEPSELIMQNTTSGSVWSSGGQINISMTVPFNLAPAYYYYGCQDIDFVGGSEMISPYYDAGDATYSIDYQFWANDTVSWSEQNSLFWFKLWLESTAEISHNAPDITMINCTSNPEGDETEPFNTTSRFPTFDITTDIIADVWISVDNTTLISCTGNGTVNHSCNITEKMNIGDTDIYFILNNTVADNKTYMVYDINNYVAPDVPVNITPTNNTIINAYGETFTWKEEVGQIPFNVTLTSCDITNACYTFSDSISNGTNEYFVFGYPTFQPGEYDFYFSTRNQYGTSTNTTVENITINSFTKTTTDITPDPAEQDDTLFGSFQFTDDNGQTSTEVQWRWYKNTILYHSGSNTSTLNSSTSYTLNELVPDNFTVDDVLIFSARTNDSLNFGNWTNSTAVTIGLKPIYPPVVTYPTNGLKISNISTSITWIDNTTNYGQFNTTIIASNGADETILTVVGNGTESFLWDVTLMNWSLFNLTFFASNKWNNSLNTTVTGVRINSIPAVNRSHTIPLSVYSNGTVYGRGSFTDNDDVLLGSEFIWYNNDVNVLSGTFNGTPILYEVLRPTGLFLVNSGWNYNICGGVNANCFADDDDSTYMELRDTTVDGTIMVAFDDSSVGTGKILDVNVTARVWTNHQGTVSTGYVKLNSSNGPSTPILHTDGYHNISYNFSNSPSGGAWTWDDIDSLIAGAFLDCIDDNLYLIELYVVVKYEGESGATLGIVPGTDYAITDLNETYINTNDDIIFSLRAYDGLDWGDWANSSIQTIVGTIPSPPLNVVPADNEVVSSTFTNITWDQNPSNLEYYNVTIEAWQGDNKFTLGTNIPNGTGYVDWNTSTYSGYYNLTLYSTSEWGTSGNTTIKNVTINTLPTINVSYILPTTAYNNDTLFGRGSFTDINEQLLKSQWIWYKNDVFFLSGSWNGSTTLDDTEDAWSDNGNFSGIATASKAVNQIWTDWASGFGIDEWAHIEENYTITGKENNTLYWKFGSIHNGASNTPFKVECWNYDNTEWKQIYYNVNSSQGTTITNTTILLSEECIWYTPLQIKTSIYANDTTGDSLYVEGALVLDSYDRGLSVNTDYLLSQLSKENVNVYDNLTFSIRANDGFGWGAWSNSSTIDITNRPLENLVILSPTNNTLSKEQLNVTFSVDDLDEGIVCSLNVNDSTSTSKNVSSGITNYINYSLSNDGDYSYNISCIANGNSTPIISENRLYIYDVTGPSIYDSEDSASPIYPVPGDTFFMNATVYDLHNVSHCYLQINDTWSWENKTLYTINNETYKLQMNYDISNETYANRSQLAWRVWCNDSVNNYNISDIQTFQVRDVTFPLIVINESLLGFNTNNLSVISSKFYNVTYNITAIDFNLFQMAVNVTCDVDGGIYYWEIFDINTTSYSKADIIDISGRAPQRCRWDAYASDDHTKNKIEDYLIKEVKDSELKQKKGVEFDTQEKVNLKVFAKAKDEIFKGKKKKTSNDKEVNNLKNVKAVKNNDRYNLEFDYTDDETERYYTVESDMPIYEIKDSNFPGHLVAWNHETMSGNWIDFAEDDAEDWTVTKVNNNKYDIKVKFKEGKGKNVKFHSIGGTNIANVSYYFYIGGTVNVNTTNRYDNTSFDNFSVKITTIDSYPGFNGTTNISGIQGSLQNMSNGTYNLLFIKPGYFNQTVNITLENSSQDINYNTFQGMLNIQVQTIKWNKIIEDYNTTIINNITGQQNFQISPSSNITTFFLNSTNYTIYVEKDGIGNITEEYTMDAEANASLILYMPFEVTFNLYDERTLGLFNVSSPDKITFILYCGENGDTTSTSTTVLNESFNTIIIDCDFYKYDFTQDYESDNFPRSFVIPLDEDNDNLTVYLIDFATTQSIETYFKIDDLLSTYDNPSIFVKRVIDDETVQITADYTDIEDSIFTYLIQNQEYIIEVHSDNLPTRVIGTYRSSVGGTKVLRLYDVGVYPQPTGFDNSVLMNMNTVNRSGTTYAVITYNDTAEGTNEVIWSVYENQYGGVPIFTTSSNEQSFELLYNISGNLNSSIFATAVINHTQYDVSSNKLLYSVHKIPFPAFEHFGDTDEERQQWLDWFFTLLIGTTALMTTIKTSSTAALLIIALAAFFAFIGWYSLSLGIVVLALVIALFDFMRREDKLQIT